MASPGSFRPKIYISYYLHDTYIPHTYLVLCHLLLPRPFPRPAYWSLYPHGPNILQASQMVRQFHYVLKQKKMDHPGIFVRLVAGDLDMDDDQLWQQWFFLGSLRKQEPLVHAMVHLVKHSEDDCVLKLEVRDGEVSMSTAHQVFQAWFRNKVDEGAETLRLEIFGEDSIELKTSTVFGNHFLIVRGPDCVHPLGDGFYLLEAKDSKKRQPDANLRNSPKLSSFCIFAIFCWLILGGWGSYVVYGGKGGPLG